MPVALFDVGFSELVVVGVVALLLFGGRLPEMMRTMGTAYRNLRRGWDDLSRQALSDRPAARHPYAPTPPSTPASTTAAPIAKQEPAAEPVERPVSDARVAAAATAEVVAPRRPSGSRADDDLPLV